MRSMGFRVLGAVAAAVLTACVSACGGDEPTASRDALLHEYFRSGDVKGDVIDGSGEDRLANLASYGAPEDVAGSLFAAHSCERPIEGPAFETECVGVEPTNAEGGKWYQRFALVKHEDGSLELLRLTLVGKAGHEVLHDVQGNDYPGGLEDFRENNELLEPADQLLVPEDVTAVGGRYEMIVVSGHTPSSAWVWWVAIGAAVVVVFVLAWFVAGRLRDRRPPPDPF